MKFEYYAVITQYGFHQAGNGSPALFKNRYTAERIARRRATNGGRVVTLEATVIAVAPQATPAVLLSAGPFLTLKSQFPEAFVKKEETK